MKSWDSLPETRKIAETLKVFNDPVYFASEYFLNLELWPKQKELIREFYRGGYQELILVGGMRLSKSFLLSYFSLLETFYVLNIDYRKKYNLVKDTPLFGLIAAGKEEQAIDAVFRKVVARLENSPYFQALPYEKYSNVIYFPKNFTVKVVSSKSATEVGRTSKFVCIDEMSRLEETTGPRAGLEVYRLLKKSTKTLKKDGHVFVVGTPKHPSDILMTLYEKGKPLKHVLAVKYATWEFNPNFTKEDFAEDFEADALATLRDFGAQPESSESVFFKNPDILDFEARPNVLAMLADNAKVEPNVPKYYLAGDPALRRDAFGLALGHRVDDTFVIDGVFRFKPKGKTEINPTEVKDFICKVVDTFPVCKIVFDTWDYPLLLQELRKRGVKVVQHIVKRDDYVFLKQKLYEGKVSLPYDAVLKSEMLSLLDLGKKVDHPLHGSKDVADAVANCIWLMNQEHLETVPLTMVRVL